ncbi:hypothetical protein NDU88_000605 [Pleurodeles waltl]|uniref:Uncharacterized protein n=1 Tax=Pleurodeles waltl TaxID=8319 RepID=A0AAV7P1S8_PLEWA|nr:hypothetical protein NDU88_000605 [Pleurodeles waltl]
MVAFLLISCLSTWCFGAGSGSRISIGIGAGGGQRLSVSASTQRPHSFSPALGASGNQAARQIWQSEGQESVSEQSKPGWGGPRLQCGSRSSRSWSAGAGELRRQRLCRAAGQAGSTLSARATEHLSPRSPSAQRKWQEDRAKTGNSWEQLSCPA